MRNHFEISRLCTIYKPDANSISFFRGFFFTLLPLEIA
jgi:hypothetical protein